MNTDLPIQNPLESLHNTIVFSVRDYGNYSKDAWIYGIIVGWDDESLKELKIKFSWDDEAINRLKTLHDRFKKLCEDYGL